MAAQPSELHPLLIIGLLLLWRPDKMLQMLFFFLRAKRHQLTYSKKDVPLVIFIPGIQMCTLLLLLLYIYIFFFTEVCMSENHFDEPSKYLEGDAVENTQLFTLTLLTFGLLTFTFLFSRGNSSVVSARI